MTVRLRQQIGSVLPLPLFPGIGKHMRLRARQNRQVTPTRAPLLVGVMLALLALINVVGMTNWHNSIVGHDDTKIQTVLVQHDNNAPSMPEIDLHKMTHSVLHGFADIAPSAGMVAGLFVVLRIWFVTRDYVVSGLPPEALLRPPRG